MKHEEQVMMKLNKEFQLFIGESSEINDSNETYVANQFTSLFIKIKKQRDQINHYLQYNTGFTFPILQENKRKEMDAYKAEGAILQSVLNKMNIREDTLETDADTNLALLAEKVYYNHENRRLKIKAEVTRMEAYYQTSAGTKIKSLLLYLSLAILLAIILVIAINILDSSQLSGL